MLFVLLQYIRKGGLTKPVREICGIDEMSEHFLRSKLCDAVPLPVNLDADIVPGKTLFVHSSGQI